MWSIIFINLKLELYVNMIQFTEHFANRISKMQEIHTANANTLQQPSGKYQ